MLSGLHTLFIRSTRYFVTYQCFSRDHLESLQLILHDAVENINLSHRTIGIRLSAEDNIVLCLVKYMLSRHIKCVTFQCDNRSDRCIVNNYSQQLYCTTSLHLLEYRLATSVLKDMIKGALCVM